jgi:hypothetical protein
MTTILQKAIERLRLMPAERQDQLARLVLHEIDEDERWMRSTEASASKLDGLVAEILEADGRGECEPLDPDTM